MSNHAKLVEFKHVIVRLVRPKIWASAENFKLLAIMLLVIFRRAT